MYYMCVSYEYIYMHVCTAYVCTCVSMYIFTNKYILYDMYLHMYTYVHTQTDGTVS